MFTKQFSCGSPFVSDVVDLATQDFDRVKVEFYLPTATGPCTCHLTGLDTLAGLLCREQAAQAGLLSVWYPQIADR